MLLHDREMIHSGFVLIAAAALFMMAALSKQRGAKSQETRLWFIGYGLQFVGIVLMAYRDSIPDLLPAVIANTLVASGMAALYAGLAAYCGFHTKAWLEVSIVSILTAAMVVFTYSAPNLTTRSIALSGVALSYAARGAILCLRRTPYGGNALFVGILLVIIAIAGALRIAIQTFGPVLDGVFDAEAFEGAVLISHAMLHLLLAFALSLMEHNRLLLRMGADAAARKKAEDVLRLRIRLYEYSADHDFSDLMRKALDETEAITSSRIGFFHFYDEPNQTLTLQAWSTATIAFFCRAEGRGMVYDLDKAGVWADAIRERRPLIHNDYASLPHKKGLPEGHATVVREAVAPILRDGHVVAIMGVGNKPFEYTEEDTAFISFIADVTYSIVERKLDDDRIRALNEELERQAMTDELTELPNRRAFFAHARRELASAKRHGTPCAILMLDLDGFKAVNDHHGHDAGDRVLKRAAATMKGGVRESDLPTRVGGEEFAVLLPHTDMEDALVLAERLRAAIQESGASEADPALRVTVSIGAALFNSESDDIDSLLKRADEALYKAKEHGKNQVYPGIALFRDNKTIG